MKLKGIGANTLKTLLASPIIATLLLQPAWAGDELSPDQWIRSATCQEVLQRMENPMAFASAETMFTSIGYVGAVMGLVEGVALATNPEGGTDSLRAAAFAYCQEHPAETYATALTRP